MTMQIKIVIKTFATTYLRNCQTLLPIAALPQRHYSSKSNNRQDEIYDVAVIGGGIVGAATAHELATRFPKLRCALLEKEGQFALHQSGRSSGVIHAGIYYQPGSLMARLCSDGLKRMYQFCEKYHISHERCGKLIVATEPEELSRLDNLYERACINKVPGITVIPGSDIKQIEPYCQGLKALHSPWTGIADYAAVTRKLVEIFNSMGGHSYTEFDVCKFSEGGSSEDQHVCISSKQGKSIQARHVITCAGLYSDKVAIMSGCESEPKIVPFRGDYLVLNENKRHMVRGNIYPVPDPKFPFLGFHYTPRTDGEIWLGPNAVLAFKREGYSPFDFSIRDFSEAVSYRGLQKLVLKNFSYAVSEVYYGINLRATVKQLQRFIPDIGPNDVHRGPSGVRAQALSSDGSLVGDFLFDGGTGVLGKMMLHVRNAPSPAATSSLAIAEMVVDEAKKRFQLTCNE